MYYDKWTEGLFHSASWGEKRSPVSSHCLYFWKGLSLFRLSFLFVRGFFLLEFFVGILGWVFCWFWVFCCCGFLEAFVCFCFVLFFVFLTARPPEQPSIWEIFPEYVDTISLLSVSVHSCSAGKGKGPAYYSLMVCWTFRGNDSQFSLHLTPSFILLGRKQYCLGDTKGV